MKASAVVRIGVAIFAANLIAHAQTYNVSGNVIDETGTPVAQAAVLINGLGEWTYTDAAGAFALSNSPTSTGNPAPHRRSPAVTTDGNRLRFRLDRPGRVTARLYALDGRMVVSLTDRQLTPGTYTLPVSGRLSHELYIVRISTPSWDYCLTYAPLEGHRMGRERQPPRRLGAAHAPAAAIDSLIVSKPGYRATYVSLTSYTGAYPDITLVSDGVEARVDSLMALMTPEEKYAQLVQGPSHQLDGTDHVTSYMLGSVLGVRSWDDPLSPAEWADWSDGLQAQAAATRLGIPLVYGIDAVHGHALCEQAVIFPHNVGMACTHNPRLVRDAWRITALETAATGIHWTFAPCAAVPQDERWGRTYEGWGERGDSAAVLVEAAVLGLQGLDLHNPATIAACPKHYVADGGTVYGTGPSADKPIDRGDATCDEKTLRRVHLAPYEAAVRAGAATIMVSYSSWQGTFMHVHEYLVNDVLKGELGFDGFVVTDYDGITTATNIPPENGNLHRTLVKYALLAGIDMFMSPGVYQDVPSEIKWLVDNNEVPQSRIDDAVRRVLRIKFRLGLFDRSIQVDRTLTARVGAQEHRDVARECVRQSLVLLKNEGSVLPLAKTGRVIGVAGPHANDLKRQCGGWTLGWGGMVTAANAVGTTILEGIRNAAGNSQNVVYSSDGTGLGSTDVIVAVVGEESYAEWFGDVGGPSIDNLQLTAIGTTVLDNCLAAGKPLVMVLVSGRPMILGAYHDSCDAVVAAWLPGSEGAGVADVLFGDYAPTGTLAHTWPLSEDQLPIGDGDGQTPLYPLGYGLSY